MQTVLCKFTTLPLLFITEFLTFCFAVITQNSDNPRQKGWDTSNFCKILALKTHTPSPRLNVDEINVDSGPNIDSGGRGVLLPKYVVMGRGF